MVLIWGLKKPHYKPKKSTTQDVAEMRRRSIILLDMLSREKTNVIAPSVAVAEVLLGIAPADHANFIAELQEGFTIQPFDIPAMALAAKLWQARRALPAGDRVNRTCLKADVMIVATAKAAGADLFFSHDDGLRKLAKAAGMIPRDLPTHHEDLFADADARKDAEDSE